MGSPFAITGSISKKTYFEIFSLKKLLLKKSNLPNIQLSLIYFLITTEKKLGKFFWDPSFILDKKLTKKKCQKFDFLNFEFNL